MEVQTVRPRIKPTLKSLDKWIEILGWVLLIFLWWETLRFYPGLPETIPVHYGLNGAVDAYGSKRMMLTLPTIASILFAGITVVNQFPHIFNYPVRITEENAPKQYAAATRLLRYIKLIILVVFGFIESKTILNISTGSNHIGAWFFPITMSLIFIPILIYIFISKRTVS